MDDINCQNNRGVEEAKKGLPNLEGQAGSSSENQVIMEISDDIASQVESSPTGSEKSAASIVIHYVPELDAFDDDEVVLHQDIICSSPRSVEHIKLSPSPSQKFNSGSDQPARLDSVPHESKSTAKLEDNVGVSKEKTSPETDDRDHDLDHDLDHKRHESSPEGSPNTKIVRKQEVHRDATGRIITPPDLREAVKLHLHHQAMHGANGYIVGVAVTAPRAGGRIIVKVDVELSEAEVPENSPKCDECERLGKKCLGGRPCEECMRLSKGGKRGVLAKDCARDAKVMVKMGRMGRMGRMDGGGKVGGNEMGYEMDDEEGSGGLEEVE